MNRSGCRLKPIAPRPAADSYAPSSAVSAVSLDPKDYVYPHADYVWGVPQQMHPGVLQQSPGYINPYMAANTGMYGAYGPMMTSQWGQQAALPQFQPQLTPTPSGPAAAPAAMHLKTQNAAQPGPATAADEDCAKVPAAGDESQVVPKLEGVDELLNIPLDEECLQKLLSGDEPDDVAMALDLGPDISGKEGGDLSGDSTCTGEGKTKKLAQQHSAEEGESASGAEDLLTTDINFGVGESSMLKNVSSFGDLDLDYLTSMPKPDTASSQELLLGTDSLDSGNARRSDMLTRAKSEAALPFNSSLSKGSPLAGITRDAALKAILDYLSSDALTSAPGDRRLAAVSAVCALQQACEGSGAMAEELCSANLVPKRKRSHPVRSGSAKSLKCDVSDLI